MKIIFSIVSFIIFLTACHLAVGQSDITFPQVIIKYRSEAKILNTDHMLIPNNYVSHLNISDENPVITNEMSREERINADTESHKMRKADYINRHPKLKIIVNPDATMYENMPDIIENYDVEAIPIFIYNPNQLPIEIELQNGGLIMIQEAKDQNGKWKPIEYYTFSWCGNSFSSFLIASQKFALAKIHRYRGSMKTELRLKLRTGEKTYYSDPFPGEIDPGQLILIVNEILDHSFPSEDTKTILKRAFLDF